MHKEAAGPDTSHTARAREPENTKVLLIDDEEEFVTTLAERLSSRGLATLVAYDGRTGLSLARSGSPDVIVVDLKMPGISGLEVLREVGRELPEIPVIILTGHGSADDRDYAMEHGAFCYLNKPVPIQTLTRCIRDARMKKATTERQKKNNGAGKDRRFGKVTDEVT